MNEVFAWNNLIIKKKAFFKWRSRDNFLPEAIANTWHFSNRAQMTELDGFWKLSKISEIEFKVMFYGPQCSFYWKKPNKSWNKVLNGVFTS